MDILLFKITRTFISAVEEVVKHLEKLGPLPWRPCIDLCQPIAVQCRLRLIEVCGQNIMKQMFSKEPQVKKDALILLEEIIRHSEVCCRIFYK